MLICCGGMKENGKGLTSSYLKQRFSEIHKTDFESIAFADPIKNIICTLYNVDLKFIEQWKNNDETPQGFTENIRQLMIHVGETFRSIDQLIWIKYLHNRRKNKKNHIVSDGRHRNEYEYIKSEGGYNCLIWRPGKENNINSTSESANRELAKMIVDSGVPEGRIAIPGIPIDYFFINDDSQLTLMKKIENTIIKDLYHA